MITVRFNSGFSVQYNAANYVSRTAEWTDLYDRKDGRWIAQVPTRTCLVEVQAPCRTYDARNDRTSQLDALETALRDRTLGHTYSEGTRLASIKALLAKFDARKRGWK